MTVDKDRLFKKLDHVGEYAVRENLERGVYGPNRRGLVEEWLQQFDVEEEPELLVEEAAVAEVNELAAKADEPAETLKVHEQDDGRDAADVSPTKKWYQRLFGRGGN